MSEQSIASLIEEAINQGGIELPVFHRVALKIQQLLAMDDYDIRAVARLIHQDQSLASHVLQSANSSFYAGLSPVKTIQDAVIRLGARSMLNVVMVVTQKQAYATRHPRYQRWIGPLWAHALGTAYGARWLAMRLGLEKAAEESFLGGLLHDVGKLLILRILERLEVQGRISDSVIDDVINHMHCEKGAHLMTHWNMPEIYTLIVQRHHEAATEGGQAAMNLVKLANVACRKVGIGLKKDPGVLLSTTPEAINLMAGDLLLAELQVELEGRKAGMERFFGV